MSGAFGSGCAPPTLRSRSFRGRRRLPVRDVRAQPALGQSMRCVSAALIVLCAATAILLDAACGPSPPKVAACAQVTSPYTTCDVMLKLQAFDRRQRALRLPQGKVVTAPAECSIGDALELLTPQPAPSSSAPVTAFRAVHVGQA